MHGNRRRKKRPSYGVRTVEINKGKNGFGFTISGQAPCILSCIVTGSPAERAGLRPGDFLIAVNSQNVSKAPHDDVARLIGISKLLKLQIAENYYSDSSDDEFVTVNRPKPKYPNRLRHKNQQTRAEKVVRDLQSGAIFSEHAAIHLGEAALLSDRDAWPESSFPPNAPISPVPSGHVTHFNGAPDFTHFNGAPEPNSNGGSVASHPAAPSTSPTRLRPDQIRLVMAAEARQVGRAPRPMKEPQYPPRPRHPTKKKDKHQSPKERVHHSAQPGNISLQHPQQSHSQQSHQLKSQQQYQTNQTQQLVHSQLLQQQQSFILQQQVQQGLLWDVVDPSAPGGSRSLLTEQEINKLLYPTLAELQQQVPPEDDGESLYRAVVGYLGTIEMPKETQGGSRLAAIRNCIRRLRIEKKVHTLVLMSVFTERVALTSPHGLTLAQYPAERITFCGIYADDKKFFGLVTVHGTSGDELSDGSQEQDGGSVSSSCHVFMVDPRMVQHVDHARRAKSFRLECTPNPENNHCQEFPDTADPILHCIMSLYRNRVGFHMDMGAPGLIDVEAQMSPQHSNTSSNSSNSDSGIGFRDEGGHPYQHNDRVFVVEVDDNQRMRIQNFQLVGRMNPRSNLNENLRANLENHRSNMDNHRSNMENHRANIENHRANIENQRSLENHRTSTSESRRINLDNHRVPLSDSHRVNIDNLRNSISNNYPPNVNLLVNENMSNNMVPSAMRANTSEFSSASANNLRAKASEKLLANSVDNGVKLLDNIRANSNDNLRVRVSDNESSTIDNLRVSVGDNKRSNDFRSSLAEARASIVAGRTSMTDDTRIALNEDLRNSLLEDYGASAIDGRLSITDEMRLSALAHERSQLKTPVTDIECMSPETYRLTVRAMPDPVGFERSPAFLATGDTPVHVASMRHSMHRYLQHKQEHLVKVSQKINRRESDTGGIHPLSVRAFSPATTKPPPPTPTSFQPEPLDLELSLKLSPKVFGLPKVLSNAVLPPVHPRAPSERSFTRSLEDIRDSSTSDGVMGPPSGTACSGSFRDGSESDHGLDRFRQAPLMRLLHASETNLSRYSHGYPVEHHRGAFRAVAPRNHRDASAAFSIGVPRMRDLVGVPLDSGDEHTETTENTGEQEGSQDVHPPTQDEFSHDSDFELVDGSDKKWQRSVSLRRQYNRSRHPGSHHMQDPGAHSDTELSKLSETHSSLLDGDSNLSIDRPIIRVSVWAASFEKLLEDKAGLHTFAEFLKKEFSHENIYFWTACERYKRISSPDERRLKASDIFDRHLGPGAAEPVNVDSQARQVAQDGLQDPDEFTFAQAQKQIFNLMKFDSYSRFLKSALYKEAEICDMRGHTLPYPGNETLDPDLRILHEDSQTKLKKSKSDADERRRKSLLPWHRKDRSRSKDRGEAEYRRRKKLGQRNTSDSSSIRSDISESRTSLNSDLANGRRAVSRESLTSGEVGSLSGSEGSNRCRVMLPDLSASVVAVRTGETCQSLLNRLLERRGISYSTFDLYLLKGDKMLDKLEDSSVLGGQEVRIEQRILFRLDFPNRKTVCVKAKPHKNTSDVLKPILAKYGYKLELMAIHKCGEDKSINLKTQVNELDGQRLVVQTKEEVKEWGVEPGRVKKRTSTLDEITNRVFNEVLEGKSDNFDELGVLDIDEKDKLRGSGGSRSSLHENITVRGGIIMTQDPAALVTKRRGSNSSNPTNPKSKQENNDELYEGLKRAQRSRLDDQRGTEINFELPDFLKCDQQSQDKSSAHSLFSEQLLHQLECSFMEGGVIPSHQEAEDYFSCAHPEVWGDLPLSVGPTAPLSANATLLAPPEEIDDLDDTILDSEALSQVALEGDVIQLQQPNIVEPHTSSNVRAANVGGPPLQALIMSPAPPPLPPKPKLGGACARGPPPRPPSRQLHLITHTNNFSSNSDDEHVQSEHMHIARQQTHDKFNISFV